MSQFECVNLLFIVVLSEGYRYGMFLGLPWISRFPDWDFLFKIQEFSHQKNVAVIANVLGNFWSPCLSSGNSKSHFWVYSEFSIFLIFLWKFDIDKNCSEWLIYFESLKELLFLQWNRHETARRMPENPLFFVKIGVQTNFEVNIRPELTKSWSRNLCSFNEQNREVDKILSRPKNGSYQYSSFWSSRDTEVQIEHPEMTNNCGLSCNPRIAKL